MGKITLTSPVTKDRYTDYIESAYDLVIEDRNTVNIPLNFRISELQEWSVLLIVGASGSGKTAILNSLGGGQVAVFDDSKSVISNFENLEPEDAAKILCAVGLSSVPTWVRPYRALSNGERYRAGLAWLLAHAEVGETIRVDEYTSVVDRNVAKSMSVALQKYVRANGLKVILASCHYDIIEWLQPDYIYDLGKGGVLERGDCLRRPSIPLRLYRTEPNTWELFRRHHYMSQDLNKAAACFVAEWDSRPVAFLAVLPMPSGTLTDSVRLSRVVVLPDYQGIGIGTTLTSALGGIYKSIGLRMFIKTVNPGLGLHMEKSPSWRPTSKNGIFVAWNVTNCDAQGHKYLSRSSYCFEYVGKEVFGHENLLKPIEQMREDKYMEGQYLLF